MISRSKLGAIAFVAALGVASPAFALSCPNGRGPVSKFSSCLNGGGSTGYNRLQQTYRLKKHPGKQHAKIHQARKEDMK